MVNKIKIISMWVGIVVVIGLGAYFLVSSSNAPGQLDNFAICLKDKGVKFYGAFWCPHCQNQKAMFGKSAKLLPYIECSTPNGRDQLQVCDDEGIKNYPTWEFPDGSRELGEVELSVLASKSSCELPQ